MRHTPRSFLTAVAITALAAAPHLLAQPKPAFEVATIKLAAPGALQNQMVVTAPNRISIPSMTLTWLVFTAYGDGMNTSANVTGGPDWMKQTAYAIEGQASAPSTKQQFQAMLRTLLEDRFGLKLHTDVQTGNIYALVVDRSDGKLGPKVKAWDGTCPGNQTPASDDGPVYPRCVSGYRPPGMNLNGATMYSVAELLSLPASRTLLGRVVQDQTGLTGRYTMELDYQFPNQRAAPADITQPSLFTAIREQWGLKLEPAQGQFKVFAVDDAHRPAEN